MGTQIVRIIERLIDCCLCSFFCRLWRQGATIYPLSELIDHHKYVLIPPVCLWEWSFKFQMNPFYWSLSLIMGQWVLSMSVRFLSLITLTTPPLCIFQHQPLNPSSNISLLSSSLCFGPPDALQPEYHEKTLRFPYDMIQVPPAFLSICQSFPWLKYPLSPIQKPPYLPNKIWLLGCLGTEFLP